MVGVSGSIPLARTILMAGRRNCDGGASELKDGARRFTAPGGIPFGKMHLCLLLLFLTEVRNALIVRSP
jgi:hypothetical protein